MNINSKCTIASLICLCGLVGAVSQAYGQAGPERNPRKVALLKWYGANQAASLRLQYGLSCIAFDGHNIWVGGLGDNIVTKIAVSDGTILGEYVVGRSSGDGSQGIAFDGTNIWVTRPNANLVTKLRASDGTNLGSFPTGPHPAGIAFDGQFIWIANYGSNTLTKLYENGSAAGTITVGANPIALAFDGQRHMWVANYGDSSVMGVYTPTGQIEFTFLAGQIGQNPVSLAYDGTNLWVASSGSGQVAEINTISMDATPLTTGSKPVGLAFDGDNIWVIDSMSATVTKIRVSDNANLGTFNVGRDPSAVAFDGANIWVASQDETLDKL